MTERATRRRGWSEHPASIPINISWTLAGLFALALAPIHGAPAAAWILCGAWIAANAAATLLARRTLTVPLEEDRPERDEEVVEGTSLLRDAMRRLRRNQLATVSMGLIVGIAVLCFSQQVVQKLGEPDVEKGESLEPDSFYALHVDHTYQDRSSPYAPPSARHWFGTDGLGRDLFARTLFGGSISFQVGLVATLVSLVIGVTWGAVAGFFGGRVDHYMMRFVDVLYGLPYIFLVILIMTLVKGLDQTAAQYRPAVIAYDKAVAEERYEDATRIETEQGVSRGVRTAVRIADLPPILIMFFALGLVQWLTMARITRGQVLSLREREFVVAARVIGAGNLRIIFRHIVPNLLGPVIVYTTLTIPTVMLSEAFLSFIGLGISEPNCSWGTLSSDGISAINVIKPYWWLITYPAAAISLALFSLNFIGDGLRDALDPKQKR